MVGQAGRSVVLETHSRDLIDGLRLQSDRHRILGAQAAARRRSKDSVTESEPAPAQLVFFRRQEDGMVRPTVHDLADPAAPMPWPEGFVDAERLERDAFEEQMATRLRPADPRSVREFIAQNEEGACVEYKAALRWNHHAARHDDEVKQSLLKAVCAFLNSAEGGRLFVGVDDNRRIVGIEHDTDGKRNDEKFLRMLVDLVTERIDPTAFPRFMDIAFVELEGKAVAVVTCRPAEEPMFLRDQQTHRFIVRCGNSSREYPVAYAFKYWQTRHVR